MTIVNFADKDTHGLDAPTQEKQIMTREYFEEMLDAGKLQTATICGGRQNWYDVFRNGKTKTWKRTGRFEIPLRFLSSDSATRPVRIIRVSETSFANGAVFIWFRTRR